ncbi:MAG TPA: glycosyltransferase [Chthoniobacteraceae bacterium]|nr:glycosyltransferase [Chthoniobacteraceae bacterium]
MNPTGKPIAAQYCATFLKPEMEHIYRQITALRAYQPVVLTQRRENAGRFPFEAVISLRRPWTRELRRFWQKTLLGGPLLISRREARALGGALRHCRASLLHVYFGHIGVHLLPFLQKARLPLIISFHGADAGVDVVKRSHLRPLRRLFDVAALILPRSQAIAEDLIQLGCPPEKIRLHRTGIPLDRFPFTQRYLPENGQWRFFQACRLIPKKGLETTLRAFAQFHRRFPGSRLTIAGEGPLAEPLRDLAAELNVASTVSFPGFVSQAKLRDLFYQSHVFLHPSVTGPNGDREGVPNTILEAMATGLPIAATQHGGIPEAVRHGETGLLVPEQSDGDLAAAMLSMASDPAQFSAMSANAARTVAAEWEIHAQTRLLEALYDEARRTANASLR